MKTYITSEQAKSVLPDGETVHAIYEYFCMTYPLGGTWPRKKIYGELDTADEIKLCFQKPPYKKHRIYACCKKNKMLPYRLYIETDEEKLARLEKELIKE